MTPSGLAVIDKPPGLTSHDVVARVRRILGTRKVGHAGTLDPMATGVLVVGVGRGTRLLTFLVGADKTYLATVRLGTRTLTDDLEGEVLERADTSTVTERAVRDGVRALTGRIEQVPSAVSAIKVDGTRAYARVRAGEQVDLPARPVTIRRFDVLGLRRETCPQGEAIELDVEVDCSSGTYVRALARDLGAGLGVGGHLTALRRVRVGPYDLSLARTLDELAAAADPSAGLTSLEQAARTAFPIRELTGDEAVNLGHGRRIPAAGSAAGPVAALAPDGTLVAILEQEGPTCRPLLVLAPHAG